MKTKRILLLSIAAIFTVFLILPVLSVPARAAAEYVIDEAGLLTEEDKQTLGEVLESVSDTHDFDVAVVVIDPMYDGYTAQDTDELYSYNGFGRGEDKSGIILVYDCVERHWAFGAYGIGETAFTEAGRRYITKNIQPYFNDSDFFSAFMFYASAVDDFMYAYEAGTPHDETTLPGGDEHEQGTFVYESVGLLSDDEVLYLNGKLAEISEKHSFAVVVATTYSLGGKSAELYGADFLESIDLALNGDTRCCILVIATEERDFGFATPTGVGSEVFTYSGQAHLDTFYLPYLREDDYFGAFLAYAAACDDFLNMYEAGTPYGSNDYEDGDDGYVPYTPPYENSFIKKVPIAAVVALIVTIITTVVLSRQLKTVRPKREAKDYVVPGSLMLTRSLDRFTHKSISKVRIDTDSGSHGGGGGGGGHSFSSSSGGSFSGHSGKY
ncbi:MAG: TPM domain-containing protein [Oscillospiraceae bacterium]|jgi:uncharacterized protein|nr:TPM domain-containing protein [Oscillospiraceae bacterium]